MPTSQVTYVISATALVLLPTSISYSGVSLVTDGAQTQPTRELRGGVCLPTRYLSSRGARVPRREGSAFGADGPCTVRSTLLLLDRQEHIACTHTI